MKPTTALISLTPKEKERLNNYWTNTRKGHKQSDIIKQRISASMLGHSKSESHRRNIAIGHLKNLDNRQCSICLSKITLLRKSIHVGNRPIWFVVPNANNELFLCNSCYERRRRNKQQRRNTKI
jgi:hypothetical protein